MNNRWQQVNSPQELETRTRFNDPRLLGHRIDMQSYQQLTLATTAILLDTGTYSGLQETATHALTETRLSCPGGGTRAPRPSGTPGIFFRHHHQQTETRRSCRCPASRGSRSREKAPRTCCKHVPPRLRIRTTMSLAALVPQAHQELS